MKKQVNWTTGVLDHVHAEVCVCVYVCVRFEPTLGVERLVFGFAVQLYGYPAGRQHLFRATRYLFTYWKNYNETWHKLASFEWPLLKRYSR